MSIVYVRRLDSLVGEGGYPARCRNALAIAV
jgi:hypothetical protein